jgi:hypothetical protein
MEVTDSRLVNDLLKRAIVYAEAVVEAGVTEYWVVDMCSSRIHGMSDANEMTLQQS